MKIIDKLDRYLNDREYKIIIKDNYLDLVNYDEIIDFSIGKISVKIQDKIITVEGKNLTISKMVENEVLITGIIFNISIN